MKKSILTKKGRLLLLMLISCFQFGFAQDEKVAIAQGVPTKNVTGIVTDKENGSPLERVSVAVKGTKIGTVTNAKGEFSLKVPTSATTLVFSYAGKTRQELPISSNMEFKVSLENENNSLNDVVVVGYGTQKRAHLTGAVATVNMKAIQDLPVGSLTEALKGQIVGVNVSGGYARPGEGATINIRQPVFLSKDGGRKDPLFVIDDIVREKSDFDLLDATEVESVSVLKDAAAAIYGILGSNGVVVVKTKRGKNGTPSISYNGSYGVSSAPMPKMMNGYEHARYLNSFNAGSKDWDMTATAALPAYYTPDELAQFKTANYDWLDMAWQTSHELRQTLNISGGSDKATYFAGFTYSDQNSNFDGLGYKRYSFRSSSDIKLATGLKLGLSLSANLI
jgi:TonB-linked SusC/RagA family outer membrane protein